jgi:hypothetical protein
VDGEADPSTIATLDALLASRHSLGNDDPQFRTVERLSQ